MIVSGWNFVKDFLIRGAFLIAGELSEKMIKIKHFSRLPHFFLPTEMFQRSLEAEGYFPGGSTPAWRVLGHEEKSGAD